MKMFFKKKKDDTGFDEDSIVGSDIDESEYDEFKELEKEDAKEKGMSLDDYEKSFIYEIEGGCPLCRGDVRGNEYYKYYCQTCNMLFDKEHVVKKDFGKHGDERHGFKVKKLTDEQKKLLADKRQALAGRIAKAFSDKPVEKEPLIYEKKEMLPPFPGMPKTEDAPDIEVEMPEPEVEVIPPERAIVEDEAEESEDVEEPEAEELEGSEPEYELEEEDKIIASRESTKIHAGNCHFVKKIHPENRIYFDTIADGEKEGYEMCVCLRRLVARRRAKEAAEE